MEDLYNEFPVQIRKKSGNLEDWDASKIIAACTKSANRAGVDFDEETKHNVVAEVWNRVCEYSSNIIPVETIHVFVEKALRKYAPEIASSYMDYRNWIKKEAEMNQAVYAECQSIEFLGDKSNSNADSQMVATKRVKKLDALETAQYREYFLNAKEKKAEAAGYIYIHDKNARLDTMNCCLFDVKAVLSGGFEMGNIWYNEPKTLETAFQVIGDITLMAASQQYGGFTLPEVDDILAPYAEKSYERFITEYQEIAGETGEPSEKCKQWAEARVLKIMRQGFQGWEYKFNTVASSRGDYPFITASFGLNTSKWGKELSKAILEVRKNGQGKEGFKKPVLFPKLVFLYDENLHGKGKEMEDVFMAGVDCSSKCMYPDFLSMTGEGYISEMYKKYGRAISPMGCRAFLSPWYERGGETPADENDKPVFVVRDGVDVLTPDVMNWSMREAPMTVYATMSQLQKMLRTMYYPKIITLSMPMNQLIETLHKFTLSYALTIVTFHEGQIVVAHDGQVISEDIGDTEYTQISFWDGSLQARAAVLALWNRELASERVIARALLKD